MKAFWVVLLTVGCTYFPTKAQAHEFVYSKNQFFTSRSMLFQFFRQPDLVPLEDHIIASASFFLHNSGPRGTIDVAAGFPRFPIGIFARMSRYGLTVKNAIFKTNRFNAEGGLFWKGATRRYHGKLGVSFIQENMDTRSGRRFISPQLTVRTRRGWGLFDSVTHVAGGIPLNRVLPTGLQQGNEEPARFHIYHYTGFNLNLTENIEYSLGPSLDFYALISEDPKIVTFSDSPWDQREVAQLMIGPEVIFYLNEWGTVRASIHQTAMLTVQFYDRKHFYFRFFHIPVINISYSKSI